MPGAIAGFTIVTADIGAAADNYARYLAYRHDGFELIETSVATAWQAPELAGARQALLRPASGNSRFIRLVEAAEAVGYVPLRHCGWTAIEIVVQDLDRIAAELDVSPFRILGPPETLDLGFTDRIRAMQVAGPSGEVLYLTEIDGPIPGFDLPAAQTLVDCAFVAVLGASSTDASLQFYCELFNGASSPILDARIECLSMAHDLPPETRHSLSTIALPDMCLLEIDAYPRSAMPPQPAPCGLPGGIAFASFHALPSDGPDLLTGNLLTGPDGERIEILRATSNGSR